MTAIQRPSWRVLLLGGISGTGKSTVAKAMIRDLNVTWVQVDDLRLTLERSLPSLPPGMEPLGFFHQPGVWSLPADALRDGLIRVGEVMAPAIEVVTGNHDDRDDAAIIEGDGILPSLFERPVMHQRLTAGRVSVVFLVEPDEEQLYRNMLERGRGFGRRSAPEQLREAAAKWRFGQWLEREAVRYGLPVVQPRPWESLVERLRHAANS